MKPEFRETARGATCTLRARDRMPALFTCQA
jgi:hypothetical protein